MTHAFTRFLALTLALAAAGCGGSDNSAATTQPTVISGPTTELFEGKLQGSGDSSFYSFTVTTTGNVNVTLASVTLTTTPGTSTNLVLGVGLGSPVATECNVTTQVATAPGLTSQLVGSSFAPAVYCVRVFDVGSVRGPINFAVRILHT
jgi:hypothetical protein